MNRGKIEQFRTRAQLTPKAKVGAEIKRLVDQSCRHPDEADQRATGGFRWVHNVRARFSTRPSESVFNRGPDGRLIPGHYYKNCLLEVGFKKHNPSTVQISRIHQDIDRLIGEPPQGPGDTSQPDRWHFLINMKDDEFDKEYEHWKVLAVMLYFRGLTHLNL